MSQEQNATPPLVEEIAPTFYVARKGPSNSPFAVFTGVPVRKTVWKGADEAEAIRVANERNLRQFSQPGPRPKRGRKTSGAAPVEDLPNVVETLERFNAHDFTTAIVMNREAGAFVAISRTLNLAMSKLPIGTATGTGATPDEALAAAMKDASVRFGWKLE